MTATVTALNLYNTDEAPARLELCGNPDCCLELTAVERARRTAFKGLCQDCHDSGVIVAEPVTEAPAVITNEQPAEVPAAPAQDVVRLPEDEDRRCGNCDHNINHRPIVALFCSDECRDNVAENGDALDEQYAADHVAPVTQEDTDGTADKDPLTIAAEIVSFAFGITEFEAKTGLRNAVQHCRFDNERGKAIVNGKAVEAARRAWIPTPDFSNLHPLAIGRERSKFEAQANGKVMPILRSAISAAMQYKAAHSPA